MTLTSVLRDSDSVRGWSWRTKTSKRGMTWALLSCGLSGCSWANALYEETRELRRAHPVRDFLLAQRGKPLGYQACSANLDVFSLFMLV